MKKKLLTYLITDPKYYTNNILLFEKKLKEVLNTKKVDIACFRDKSSSNFEELAKVFVKTCKEFEIKQILLNSDYLLAKKLNATGVHLTSTQFDKIKKIKNLGLYTMISCHNYEDLNNALSLQVDAVSYSPIFKTPNKGEPLGLDKLNEAINTYKNLNIIALGGIINENQIQDLSKINAFGFASIRYFIS